MHEDHFEGNTMKRIFVFIINHQMPLLPVCEIVGIQRYLSLTAASPIFPNFYFLALNIHIDNARANTHAIALDNKGIVKLPAITGILNNNLNK
jgi:hypothetical protein